MNDLDQIPRPAGSFQTRTLNFFWLVDCSGSMSGTKISSLNYAINEALIPLKDAAQGNPQVKVMMRVICFSSQAGWHVGPTPVPLEQFRWDPIKDVGGLTATASAIRLLAQELDVEKMPPRGLPPVCVLLSDGNCTEGESEYALAIKQIKGIPWGKKAVRLAIAIGEDCDEEQLKAFVSHPEIGVLKASTPELLVNYIIWASTVATAAVSQGKSATSGAVNVDASVHLPEPTADMMTHTVADPNINAQSVF
jgi:uncharacterized protein YegL